MIDIKPEDIRIDCFKTKDQSNWLNQVPKGVRVTYIPTGVYFESSSERSQYKNRSKAFDQLFAHLKDSK